MYGEEGVITTGLQTEGEGEVSTGSPKGIKRGQSFHNIQKPANEVVNCSFEIRVNDSSLINDLIRQIKSFGLLPDVRPKSNYHLLIVAGPFLELLELRSEIESKNYDGVELWYVSKKQKQDDLFFMSDDGL